MFSCYDVAIGSREISYHAEVAYFLSWFTESFISRAC